MKPAAPLSGKSVLVTRARGQSATLTAALRDAGAAVAECPAIAIADPPSWESLDAVLTSLSRYSWIVFTSANGADAFFRRLAALCLDAAPLAGVKVAAVGSATAGELRTRGVEPDAVPRRFRASEMAPLLGDPAGLRVAVVRAAIGREELIDTLREGGAVVDLAVAYQTLAEEIPPDVVAMIAGGVFDAVTFTSPSTVDSLFAGAGDAGRTRLAAGVVLGSIGPVTSEALRRHGVRRIVEADEATAASLAGAIIDALAPAPERNGQGR
jgi:uroporphyrinogen III methyltransferase / synthase